MRAESGNARNTALGVGGAGRHEGRKTSWQAEGGGHDELVFW